MHVPKTGGTSIEEFFVKNDFKKHFFSTNHPLISSMCCSPQHLDVDICEKLFNLHNFDYVFMTVRNPVERLKSQFLMDRNNDLGTPQEKEFSEWINRTFQRYGRNSYIQDNHIKPQSQFYIPGCHIYKLEDGFSELPHDISRECGADLKKPEIPHSNKRKDKKGITTRDVIISPLLENRILTFYKQDFLLFDYHTEV